MKKVLKYAMYIIGVVILALTVAFFIFYVNIKDWGKFQSALINNDTTTLQKLLDNGYDINSVPLKPYIKATHLHTAIYESESITNKTIEFLIQNGADINYAEQDSYSPIFSTVVLKRPDLTKMLINYGADTGKIFQGKSIIDFAILADLPEVIMMIPAEKITMGSLIQENPGAILRVVQFYDTGRTDDRIIKHLLNHNLFTPAQISDARRQMN